MTINKKFLLKTGWESGPLLDAALEAVVRAQAAGERKRTLRRLLAQLRHDPTAVLDDPYFGELAKELAPKVKVKKSDGTYSAQMAALYDDPVPYKVWGAHAIEQGAIDQLERACRLPVAVRGAQMPDGHQGYGLPIGGVLATRGAVIPYAVGVDIACRMKLSVTEMPMRKFAGKRDQLRNALVNETAFGTGCGFRGRKRRDHAVMEDATWGDLPVPLMRLRDKAWTQLGSSGSGNHFVEWGEFRIDEEMAAVLGIPAGEWLALLSHSGSRGFGATVAGTYTRRAQELCPLPGAARHLAWLDMRGADGQEYWAAMELAGRYAEANHATIHREVLKAAGLKPLAQVENHHNFAWREEHYGEEVIVHRKGATPAGEGVLGVIPGSMGDPGFVVRGRGCMESLDSAAHGAGRLMSRKKAKESITGSEVKKYLAESGVDLIAAGIDEAPQAYKPIREVMATQADLVDVVGEFHPRIVRMADG